MRIKYVDRLDCCPNCGSTNVVLWRTPISRRWTIFCEECGFNVDYHKSKYRAGKKWNKIHRNPENWK